MGRVIFITSFKGGVGKTTVSANLAAVLAKTGKKVLAVDGDFGMRCLDIALGLESDVVYDINDVLGGRVDVESAMVQSENVKNLYFLPSPITRPEKFFGTYDVICLFKKLRREYDYIIIDSSAEESPYYYSFAAAADDAVIVSQHQTLSIRAAEKTALKLRSLGFRNLRLVINSYRESCAKENTLPSVYEIINLSAVKLLGVIPYDENIVTDEENGMTAFSVQRKKASPYEAAFYNLAMRIIGKNIPLFRNVTKPVKQSSFVFDIGHGNG